MIHIEIYPQIFHNIFLKYFFWFKLFTRFMNISLIRLQYFIEDRVSEQTTPMFHKGDF